MKNKASVTLNRWKTISKDVTLNIDPQEPVNIQWVPLIYRRSSFLRLSNIEESSSHCQATVEIGQESHQRNIPKEHIFMQANDCDPVKNASINFKNLKNERTRSSIIHSFRKVFRTIYS
jgi:hypothetical protein